MTIMATTSVGGVRGNLDDLASRSAWDEDPVVAGSPYEAAPWPEVNRDEHLGAINMQGKKLPAGLDDKHLLNGDKLADNKVTIVVFWGAWCGPSHRAVDVVEGVTLLHGRKIQAVAMAGQDEKRSQVEQFLADKSFDVMVGFDQRQTLYRALDVEAIPHAVLISTDGTIRWQGNPLDPRFNEAVRGVVDADPGVAYKRVRAAA